MNTLTADDLAGRLAELLHLLGEENTPLAEAGEIGAVDFFAAKSMPDAETYVQRRLAYALRRLTDPFATGLAGPGRADRSRRPRPSASTSRG